MRVLALDFDGVISDSAPECFRVALRTWAALFPGQPVTSPAVAGERLGGPADPLYGDFLALMPLGNRAEDFGVALSILARGVSVSDQAAFDAERLALGPDFSDRFHERFYRERAAFAAEDPEGWRRGLGPYPAVIRILRSRSADTILAIATAKDRPTVRALLRDYGIDDLFPDERVLDKESGRSKRAHLQELARRLGVDLTEMTFIDDKVNHLDDVAPLGVRCALAAWGYNGEREHRLGRSRGYLVCGLEDFETQLFGASPRREA